MSTDRKFVYVLKMVIKKMRGACENDPQLTLQIFVLT